MPRRIVVRGCSGGGETTPIDGPAQAGHATVTEPDRRGLLAGGTGGEGRVRADRLRVARHCLTRAGADQEAVAVQEGPMAFDRAMIDARTALHRSGAEPGAAEAGPIDVHRDADPAVCGPSRSEPFRQDAHRRHDFDAAIRHRDDLPLAGPACGCTRSNPPPGVAPERCPLRVDLVGPGGSGAGP